MEACSDPEDSFELRFELAGLYTSAGLWALALEQYTVLRAESYHAEIFKGLITVLSKLGRLEEMAAVHGETTTLFQSNARVRSYLNQHVKQCKKEATKRGGGVAEEIEEYGRWTLSAIEPVSAHSA